MSGSGKSHVMGALCAFALWAGVAVAQEAAPVLVDERIERLLMSNPWDCRNMHPGFVENGVEAWGRVHYLPGERGFQVIRYLVEETRAELIYLQTFRWWITDGRLRKLDYEQFPLPPRVPDGDAEAQTAARARLDLWARSQDVAGEVLPTPPEGLSLALTADWSDAPFGYTLRDGKVACTRIESSE